MDRRPPGPQWGGGASWRLSGEAGPHEAYHLKLDVSKAAATLGWRPRTDLGTALDWIVEWYKTWHAGGDVRAASDAQVERFLAAEERSRSDAVPVVGG